MFRVRVTITPTHIAWFSAKFPYSESFSPRKKRYFEPSSWVTWTLRQSGAGGVSLLVPATSTSDPEQSHRP